MAFVVWLDDYLAEVRSLSYYPGHLDAFNVRLAWKLAAMCDIKRGCIPDG